MVGIGIIGDFNGENPAHIATNEGLRHAADALGIGIEAVWLTTDEMHDYGRYEGLFRSPGSPYESLDGDAAHAESDPYASCLFVTPLSCSLVGKTMEVAIKPGSKAALALGTRSREKFYCNFGLNPEYQEQLEQHGLEITGRDQNKEARIVELSSHPFFLGTLFVPQASSGAGKPHPLILEFCRSAVALAV
jgi:CTP synthase (UTP-ammonia lyase)